jgi:FixJ family two-component response regulator
MTGSQHRTTANLVLVEDDTALCEALAFSLRLERFAVRTFHDAESFLRNPDVARWDCLIIDLKLPRMDGLDLIQRLRDLGWTTPALLITTPTPAAMRRATAAKVPVLEKPLLDAALLSSRVRDLIAA